MAATKSTLARDWQAHVQVPGTFINDAPQTSTLLTLPPELRNEIYAFSIIKPLPILVRAERTPTGFRFYPDIPALSVACRELKRDTESVYYGQNTLYFTESMFQTGALSAFVELHGEHLQHITRIVARHFHWVVVHESFNYLASYRAFFAAQIDEGGAITLTKNTALMKGPAMHGEAAVCCCTVAALAKHYSGIPATGCRAGTLMGMLVDYAQLLADVDEKQGCDGRGRSESGLPRSGGVVRCAACGKVKAA